MAPRPRQNSHKSSHRRRSSQKFKNNQNSVKILSIESFSNGTVHRQVSMDSAETTGNNVRMPNLQRLLSIPEVLLNATASVSGSGLPACSGHYHINHHHKPPLSRQISAENATTSQQTKNPTPRSRLVNMFANREQVRPVYAPKHPIDLEGLQETAV